MSNHNRAGTVTIELVEPDVARLQARNRCRSAFLGRVSQSLVSP
jgi:hypothetical protein